jgi:hypothetical protein
VRQTAALASLALSTGLAGPWPSDSSLALVASFPYELARTCGRSVILPKRPKSSWGLVAPHGLRDVPAGRSQSRRSKPTP